MADRTSRYNLSIRQQPEAARACGMGNQDRRVVDPPPIVQLTLKDFDPCSTGDIDTLRNPYNAMHCLLLNQSGEDITQAGDTRDSQRVMRGLTGCLMASPFCGVDAAAPASNVDNARLGCFFIFPDLSIRQPGRYRLRFTLVSQVVEGIPTGSTTPILGVIESDLFDVYTAKDFPGMKASTPLTIDLKRQGVSVSVKKGSESQKGKPKGQGQKRSSDVSGEDAIKRSQDTSTQRRRH
ncbi:MAG: hypothetical protein Q9207_001865 [Kuettlingeria erythrocarpa]